MSCSNKQQLHHQQRLRRGRRRASSYMLINSRWVRFNMNAFIIVPIAVRYTQCLLRLAKSAACFVPIRMLKCCPCEPFYVIYDNYDNLYNIHVGCPNRFLAVWTSEQ